MPFENEPFDFLLWRAVFKNFSNPVRAVQELYCVLKPGGQVLIIDLRRDPSPREINQQVYNMGLSWASKIITKLTFRFMLLKSDLPSVDVQDTLTGLEVRAAK